MKGRIWPAPSASCAPTTWCGTTWWAITSRARRRRRSTCCTGTATRPACRPWYALVSAHHLPGKPPGPALARPDLRRRRSTWTWWTSRSTSMARAKTTSCRLRAPTPPPRCAARQEALCDGASGHIAGRDQPPGSRKSAATGCRSDGKLPKTMPPGWKARRASLWQLVDRLVRPGSLPGKHRLPPPNARLPGTSFKAIEPRRKLCEVKKPSPEWGRHHRALLAACGGTFLHLL